MNNRILAILAASLLTMQPAGAKTLQCQFDPPFQLRIIPATLTVSVDDSTGAVRVDDPEVRQVSTVRMSGTTEVSNNARDTYIWRTPVYQRKDWPRGMSFSFSLTVYRGGTKAMISYTALATKDMKMNYAKGGSVDGTCVAQ